MFLRLSLLLMFTLGLTACGSEKEQAETATADQPKAETPQVETMPADQAGANLPEIAEIPYEDFEINPDDIMVTESGLRYVIREKGSLAVPQPGQTVVAHYTGFLPNGEKFDSSVDRGQPFEFPLGQGRVIKGWDIGFSLFPIGTKAVLIVPPQLGYGNRDMGNIPPNSTLIFEVELLSVK